jgi:hypothetical protein
MSIKDIPSQFKIDSEEDVRIMVISYFSELGFDADEISCEDYFSVRLGHTTVDIDKKRLGGRSDILFTRNERPIAIVETKAPSHDLTDEDAQQAISYARLLAAIAPFAIVTNGKETKVYDVFADGLVLVDDPQESIWSKNGQKISASALSEDLLYEAAKTLIAVNNETVGKFCAQQVEVALHDLKSDLSQNKKYIPELYVERHLLDEKFTKWLKGGLPVFAVVAPSGYGKTNFMCAKVEEFIASDFVLFYSSGRFTSSFVDSIRNDFIWEFHRETNIAKILSRLDSIAQSASKKLYIFLDAVDETPAGIRAIKNELLDLVQRIQQSPNVRLILSCKSFDWASIVIDGSQSFNLLAEIISPKQTSKEQQTLFPDADKVGVHLDEFTTEELAEATGKYKISYSLDGEFYGELLEESRNPLMLRFISEIYSEKKEKLPTAISSLDLFALYLTRKLTPLENSSIGEIILTKLATLIFDTGMRSFPKDELLSNLNWNADFENTLQSLFRLGILSKTFSDEQEKVGFEFNKFFLYVYVFRVNKLHSLSSDEQITHILEFIKTLLGREALEFYFLAVNQDVAHKTFIELSKHNFPVFIQILTGLESIKRIEKSPIPVEHIINYLEFYNYFRDNFFSKVRHTMMPYANVPLGVLFIKDTPTRFRGCTPSNPQALVSVEDQDFIKQLFTGPISKELSNALMPVGSYHIGGIHDFAQHPQRTSYKHLMRELSTALSNRLLNESSAKDLLRERIYSVLRYSPSMWVQGDDLPHERYWQILGYNSIEEIGYTKVSSLLIQINDLLIKFSSKLKTRDNLYPSYMHRSNDLFMVLFSLMQMNPDDTLGHLKYSADDLYSYHEGNFDSIITSLEQLLHIVVDSYKIIFEANFPELTAFSLLYNNIEKLVILEALRTGHSDFPTLSYIIAPSLEKVPPTKIVTAFKNSSVIEKLHFKSLHGGGYSMGGGFGYFELDIEIDDFHLQESEAWAIRTRYPSRTPVLDQVYSLIANEFEYFFNADRMDWENDLSSRLVNDRYLQLAASEIKKIKNI